MFAVDMGTPILRLAILSRRASNSPWAPRLQYFMTLVALKSSRALCKSAGVEVEPPLGSRARRCFCTYSSPGLPGGHKGCETHHAITNSGGGTAFHARLPIGFAVACILVCVSCLFLGVLGSMQMSAKKHCNMQVDPTWVFHWFEKEADTHLETKPCM